MHFPTRLIQLRKQNALSQQRLADAVDLHVNQIKRYEAGTAQPTLDTLVSLAKALHVSLDELVFETNERGPVGDDLKLLFEAVDHFSPEDKQMAKRILQGLIIQAQVQNLAKAS